MTDYFKKNSGVGISLLILALVCLAAVIGAAARRKQEPSSATPADIKRALREKGIKEAARLKRNYVGTDDVGSIFQFDLDSLASYSDAVVVGVPTSNVCKVSTDGESIVTEYSLAVQRILKGKQMVGAPITVVLPGGRVQFEDGSTAEIITPGFRKMQTGNTYVLFLTGDKKNRGVYRLTGGFQGLFDLSSGIVSPHGRAVDEVVKKHKGQEASKFVEMVDAKAKKHPETKECCFQ